MNNHKIKLLSSANWSKINWDLSCQSVIEIAEILPKVGLSYEICLFDSEAKHTSSGKHLLLWLPPHSELNGLSDQRPEEILKAYVIEAELFEGEWVQKGTMSNLERKFTANIISLRKLMDFLSEINQTQHDVIRTYLTESSDHVNFYRWDQFCLISINNQYKQCELFFKIVDEEFHLIFIHDWLSYCYDCLLCQIKLNTSDMKLITKYLIPSNRCRVWVNKELRDDQIEGVTYI